MSRQGIAKLFRNGRSQAVRLPREFRFAGDQVRISRTAEGVLLEPIVCGASDWFAEMDRHGAEPLKRPSQPKPPRRKIFR